MNRAILTVGLGYGDEGKGTSVDWLTQQHNAVAVVRYNGGAQAAHNVVTNDGRHHTFSQFGSGTFHGAQTFLSKFMLVNPVALMNEAEHLKLCGVKYPLALLKISRDALLTTPFHIAANQLKELYRGEGRHGSCGMGIGETTALAIDRPDIAPRLRDAENSHVLHEKLLQTQQHFSVMVAQLSRGRLAGDAVWRERMRKEILCNTAQINQYVLLVQTLLASVVHDDQAHLHDLLRRGNVIFEGAQGVLLDQDFGFHPHTTWTNTTLDNAYELLDGVDAKITKVGITRTFAARHGAGPLVTEIDEHGFGGEVHNQTQPFQGVFRRGHFDAVATRYAVDVLGRRTAGLPALDEVFVTHVDCASTWRTCERYSIDNHRDDGLFTYEDAFEDAFVQGMRLPDNLAAQTRLTQAISHAAPWYPAGKQPLEDLLLRIERATRAPVTLLSSGRTIAHKQNRCHGG